MEKVCSYVLEDLNKISKEFSKYFGIRFGKEPKLIILKSRKEIDKHHGRKTDDWIVGFAYYPNIYYLDPNLWEKYSCHKKPKVQEWNNNIRHEIIHLYTGTIYGRQYPIYPAWLSEGISVYLSNELSTTKYYKKPKMFTKVIDFYGDYSKSDYAEAGYLVKFLMEKCGKKKLLKLLENAPKRKAPKKFNELFKKIYGFDLTYSEINKKFL